jgi:hypothetical protein
MLISPSAAERRPPMWLGFVAQVKRLMLGDFLAGIADDRRAMFAESQMTKGQCS